MRIALVVIGFVSALIAPPWLPAICIVLLSLRYRAWEVILLGVLIDLTWQPSALSESVLHALPLFTMASIFVVWAFEPIRSQFLR